MKWISILTRTLNFRNTFSAIILVFCSCLVLMAQDEDKEPVRPVDNMFESNWLADNQTAIVPYKGTLEMDMSHRFGTVKNGYDDFWGLYAPSNIRIGFSYVPVEKFQMGFGFTKERLLWDLNAKYALVRQGRNAGSPLSITYYVNMGIDTRDGQFHEEFSDRLTYFHQVMFGRKFSDVLSLQTSISVSHFNAPDLAFSDQGELTGKMATDHLALAFLGRYVLTDGTNLIANFDIPMTSHSIGDPEPNYSFGIEFTSSAHAFQIFMGNFQSIVPQYNNARNRNDAGETEFLIGFNITRLWSF